MKRKRNTCNFALLSSLRCASATYSGLLTTILPFISRSYNHKKKGKKRIIRINYKGTKRIKKTRGEKLIKWICTIQSRISTHSSRCFFDSWESNKSQPFTYTIRVRHDLEKRRTRTTLNMFNSLSWVQYQPCMK